MTSLWVYSCQRVFVFLGRQFAMAITLPPRPAVLGVPFLEEIECWHFIQIKKNTQSCQMVHLSDPKTPVLVRTYQLPGK